MRRAVKVASLTPEAQETAREVGLGMMRDIFNSIEAGFDALSGADETIN